MTNNNNDKFKQLKEFSFATEVNTSTFDEASVKGKWLFHTFLC